MPQLFNYRDAAAREIVKPSRIRPRSVSGGRMLYRPMVSEQCFDSMNRAGLRQPAAAVQA